MFRGSADVGGWVLAFGIGSHLPEFAALLRFVSLFCFIAVHVCEAVARNTSRWVNQKDARIWGGELLLLSVSTSSTCWSVDAHYCRALPNGYHSSSGKLVYDVWLLPAFVPFGVVRFSSSFSLCIRSCILFYSQMLGTYADCTREKFEVLAFHQSIQVTKSDTLSIISRFLRLVHFPLTFMMHTAKVFFFPCHCIDWQSARYFPPMEKDPWKYWRVCASDQRTINQLRKYQMAGTLNCLCICVNTILIPLF